MTIQQKDDIAFVLVVLEQMPCASIANILEGMNNTEEELDQAMKRLGKDAGVSSGIL